MFDQFYTTLESLGIVPVVVLDKVEDAAPLAHALMAAGMKSAEVTFRTACAAECIAAMAEAEPEMCVGAGTVLTVEQVEQARTAGANVEEYLSSSAIIACGGTWMVKPALFADGDFSKVEQIAREAMDVVKKVRG